MKTAQIKSSKKRVFYAWLLIALVALLSVVYAVLHAPATAGQARIQQLEQEVRCPTCGDLSVYQSKTAGAYSIAAFIRHEVAAGQSNEEIVDQLVATYGDSVLMAPPTNGVGLYLWLLPIGVAGVLGWEVYRSVRRKQVYVPVFQGEKVGENDAAEEAGYVTKSGSNEIVDKSTNVRRFSRPPKWVAYAGGGLVLLGIGFGAAVLVIGRQNSQQSSISAELTAGKALSSIGAIKASEAQFEKVIAADPSNAEANAYLGWLRFNAAKSAKVKSLAIQEMSSAVSESPGYAPAQLFYGLALYYGEHSPTRAVAHLNSFLSDNPPNAMIVQAAPLVAPVYHAAGRKLPAAFGVR
jgi:cytochrome c-type biogenesis protein CcmH